ncbi:MAG: hypothetical protein A3H44_14675 [Gammaproteobacteria bacterium RIFCSPLOWO2_02_FULL_57_10]|nr:MAG: hypothetical protein A3H44_14675 [Gammaproteobacteria bacterium RIFCSPLOWO2_02_FULL_57_10]
MTPLDIQTDMLKCVASALGPDLRTQMTFVGGCTTGLLITDDFTREQVRSTDDVDLIVHVIGYMGFMQMQERLKASGFQIGPSSAEEPMPICAMTLGALRVDFMPDDENILGFSNRWYRQAVETATDYPLDHDLIIKLVHPVYFLATKLEAYKHRGKGDPLESRDIEDILNVVDGRQELLDEVSAGAVEIRRYISEEISTLLQNDDFAYAVQSQSRGDGMREALLFERLESLARVHQ